MSSRSSLAATHLIESKFADGKRSAVAITETHTVTASVRYDSGRQRVESKKARTRCGSMSSMGLLTAIIDWAADVGSTPPAFTSFAQDNTGSTIVDSEALPSSSFLESLYEFVVSSRKLDLPSGVLHGISDRTEHV